MEKDSKDNFIFDTSALISIEIVGLLEELNKLVNIIITGSVIEELENFSRFDDAYGNTSKKILKYKDKFIVKKAVISKRIQFIENTDNELFNLALKEKLILITDDVKMSYHAGKHIETYFSTFFLGLFISMNILSKKEAVEKLEKLRDLRSWNNNIIYLTTKKELETL